MSRHTIKRTAKVCFDIFLFLLIIFAEYAIHKWWKPFRRGFFCGDESLSYPFRESTIGLFALGLIVFCVPTLVILAVELFKHIEPSINKHQQRKSSSSPTAVAAAGSTSTPPTSGGGGGCDCRLGYRLLQCYKQIGYYLFGLGLILLATELPKFAVGRLRPNFFAVCQPQMLDGSTCDDEINQGHYITEFTCLGTNMTQSAIKQTNQSFPSGHSSILFYAMLYLSIYLQAMLSTRASKLLKHLLQFIFMMFALYVSLTRVSDYWHHWSDVLAGIILGTITAIIVAFYMTDLFERKWWYRGGGTTYKTHHQHHHLHRMTENSSNSSIAKSAGVTTGTALPAYTFGTLPYLHYTPQHPHQYSHATYQNYGYVP